MEKTIEFNLEDQINNWASNLSSEPSITESDVEELKCHLLDLMDELQESGLDEEEAFWVASKRLGSSFEWAEDYGEGNKQVIQLRRSLLIFAGVLAYFLLYYFIRFSSKLLFIVLLLRKTNGYHSVDLVAKYLIGAHFAFIFFVVSLYFLEKKTVSFIENVKLKPRHTLLLLFTAVVFGIIDTCLFPIAKSLMGLDNSLRSKLYTVYLYFDYSFPLIICVCFVIIYFKYYRKAKF
ncbi:MAG: permease prefix domain 1-containing protein [Prolixibacteraceae bacterium]|jgi:hypothetical protein|nr:permease prefix domain 1-containing protein [Prolixibacteraceae bacterium]